MHIMKTKAMLGIAILSLFLAYPLSQHKDVMPEPTVQKHTALKQASQIKVSILLNPTAIVASTVIPTQSFACTQYRAIFEQYSWNVNQAMAICQAESSGNTNALSPSCDRGLMQVNCVHSDMVGSLNDLFIPSINVSVAYKLYQKNGWQPWVTYQTGTYIKYL